MSRLIIACALLTALTTSASARAVRAPDTRFAQPPRETLVDQERVPPQLEIMPTPALDRATVRAALIKQRDANLARFRAYQKAGTFPSNTYQGKRLNVWRDEDGHLCAAATVIRASGQVELVDRVAAQNNFIRLADVKQGPLMDWILTSGLTQEEIVAIQEPFMPVTQPEPIEPKLVDARLRKIEDARLRKVYQRVDAMIVRNRKASVELAVDRLMKHPNLAWTLVSAAS